MFKVFVEGLESACDVPTLVDFLDERNDVVHERIGMMGVSMGGFISLLSATKEKRLKSIVSMGGGGDLENLLNKTQLLNVLPFKVLTRGIKKEIKELTDKIDPLCKLEKFFTTAILLINGSSDRIVPFECAKKLYHKLKPYYEEAPSKLVLKEYVNMGHQFTPEMYEEAISWFERTL